MGGPGGVREPARIDHLEHLLQALVLLSDQVILMNPRPGRVAEILDVPLPHPRWSYDVRARPEFIEMRAYLWSRIKAMVASDPESEFYLRDVAVMGEASQIID